MNLSLNPVEAKGREVVKLEMEAPTGATWAHMCTPLVIHSLKIFEHLFTLFLCSHIHVCVTIYSSSEVNIVTHVFDHTFFFLSFTLFSFRK